MNYKCNNTYNMWAPIHVFFFAVAFLTSNIIAYPIINNYSMYNDSNLLNNTYYNNILGGCSSTYFGCCKDNISYCNNMNCTNCVHDIHT